MKANRKNLRTHARALLGVEWTEEKQKELLRECLTGFTRDRYCHVSHDRASHLDRIGTILGTYGTEGMILDKDGNDLASQCTEQGATLDVQYCNAGDTYALTIMYVNGVLTIGDWGTLVEGNGL